MTNGRKLPLALASAADQARATIEGLRDWFSNMPLEYRDLALRTLAHELREGARHAEAKVRTGEVHS